MQARHRTGYHWNINRDAYIIIYNTIFAAAGGMYGRRGQMAACDVEVLADETLEELGRGGMMILQKRQGFRFGTDSILLAHFAGVRGGARVGDFGTGSGILPLLMSDDAPRAQFDAWEIQPDIADMAARSVKMNGLEQRIRVHAGDARRAAQDVGHGALDMVVCNPPYYRSGAELPSESESLRIAKHGAPGLLDELMSAAAQVLRHGGKLCAVYPAGGAVDMVCTLRARGLEPKRLRFVHSRLDRPPQLLLVEAMRGARPGVRILAPLALSDLNGAPTAELRAIYRLDSPV